MKPLRFKPLDEMNTEELRDALETAEMYIGETEDNTAARRFWSRRADTARDMLSEYGYHDVDSYLESYYTLDSYDDGEALASAGFGTDEDYGG